MTFPFSEFAKVEIEQVVDARLPDSRYKRSRTEGHKRPYWLISLTSIPMKYGPAMACAAQLDALMGPLTVFPLQNPLPALAVRAGLTCGQVDQKDTAQIHIDGFLPNQLSAALAGDFIQYTNHQKVYRIVFNADADASGKALVTITPPLHVATTLNEPIKYGAAVIFQCSLEDSYQMTTRTSGKLSVFDTSIIEQG